MATAKPFCASELVSFIAVKLKICEEHDAPTINKHITKIICVNMPSKIIPNEANPIKDKKIKIFFRDLKYSELAPIRGPLIAKPTHNNEVKNDACCKDRLYVFFRKDTLHNEAKPVIGDHIKNEYIPIHQV